MVIKDEFLDPYQIHGDGTNYTVVEQTTVQSGKNKGKTIYATIGYFSSVKNALIRIAKIKAEELADNVESISVSEYAVLIKSSNDAIVNAIDKLTK